MSSELTHISAIQISNYATLDALKVDIIKTLARWFPNNYVYDEHNPLDSWAIREGTEIDILCNGTFQFELLQVDIQHVYELTMYGVGRYRRHGSSCDFFERIFDSLEQQLKHPSPPFATMLDAHQASVYENRIVFGTPFQYTHSNSALPLPGALAETVVYDEEEEGLDEEAVLREDDYYNDRNGGYGGNDGGYFARDDYGMVLDNDGMVLDVGSASLDADEILLTTEDAGILSDEDSESLEDEDSESEDSEDEDSDDEDSDDESEEDSDDESSVDSDEEDELIMSMPLRDMTDNQIDRYIDLSGQEPRDEIKEWSSNFRGGAIPRYSYVNFANAWITDQNVSNVTIRRARFAGCTLRNFQFEQVHFHECDFKSVTLENVTFKDCQFTECDLATYMSLDNSCSVENFDYEDERLEDNVTYRYC